MGLWPTPPTLTLVECHGGPSRINLLNRNVQPYSWAKAWTGIYPCGIILLPNWGRGVMNTIWE